MNIVPAPTDGPNGVAWEFTAQLPVALKLVDRLYGESAFKEDGRRLRSQLLNAQKRAPFGDGRGLVASTMQGGDQLPPYEHCLSTPFQCVPQRVGIAATVWGVFTMLNINPFKL